MMSPLGKLHDVSARVELMLTSRRAVDLCRAATKSCIEQFSSSIMSNTKTPDQVDVRGPRFAAWITTAVLVITLLVSAVSPPAAAIILGVQSVVFAIGAVA